MKVEEHDSVRTRLRRRLPGARVLRDGTVLYWWVEIVAILIFYFVYSQIRNANGNDPTAAFANARDIIHWQRLIGIYHEQTLQSWALHFRPHHRVLQLLVRLDALHRDRRRDGLPLPQVERRLPDLAQHPRHRDRHRADRVHPLPAHAAAPPARPLRLRPPHPLHDLLDDQRGQEHLQPVRRDAERPLRMGALVCVRAGPPPEADLGQVARRDLPGDHRGGHRPHRQPLLPRRGRRLRGARCRLRCSPARSPAPGAAPPRRRSSPPPDRCPVSDTRAANRPPPRRPGDPRRAAPPSNRSSAISGASS